MRSSWKTRLGEKGLEWGTEEGGSVMPRTYRASGEGARHPEGLERGCLELGLAHTHTHTHTQTRSQGELADRIRQGA